MSGTSHETWSSGYDEGRRHGHKEAADKTRRVDPPSGWKIEQAMSVWHSVRARLLNEDAGLAHDEAALSDLLGHEEGDVRDVLARVLRAAKHAESMADAAKEQIADMKGRQDRYKRRSEQLRATGFAILDAIGETRVELADLTASVRAGVPSLILSEDAVLPDEYVLVTRAPDRAAIVAGLKQGAVIDGAVLSNGLPYLAIRSA